jgi:uncharacterized protein with von Willebrand factor type A (vWA) domain
LDGVLALVGRSFDGGTDLDGPLHRAAALVAERAWRDADLLVLTDGEVWVSPPAQEAIRLARERFGTRCVTVLVGDDAGAVASFSDRVWRVGEGLP